MKRRVLLAVTHLLGAGHLSRTAALARSFAAAGHRVTLATGGMPAPLIRTDGVEVVQLPPVKVVGTAFQRLLDPDGQPVGPDYLTRRRKMLLDAFRATAPDILVTELFPFGRRVLGDEFLALVAAARGRPRAPLLVASVRDILVTPGKPERVEETHARLALYDAVLVHGDPDLIPLDLSWPVAALPDGLVHYTGYVDEAAEPPLGFRPVPPELRREIVVSGGSSAASLPLFRAAIEAGALVPERPWRILVGGAVEEPIFAGLQAAAPAHVTVERARRDFRALLAGAALSVSQAGYNTAVDLLRTGVRAVFVPFEAGQETEQRLRADRLAAAGLAHVLPEDRLSGAALAGAVCAACAAPPAPCASIKLDGAVASVALVERLAALGPGAAAPRSNTLADWSLLDDALRRLADRGRSIEFWWRDDDVVAPTAALDRLLELARRAGWPLALAAIPARLEPALVTRLASEPHVQLLVHGLRHANHAPEGRKKAEFGADRPLAILITEAELALDRARSALGGRVLPVFVPPWNRIASDLVAQLPRLGYRGVSRFGRRSRDVPGLAEVNVHLDLIDWRQRRLVEPQILIARLAGAVTEHAAAPDGVMEPIGLLTHHLVHDEGMWAFCEDLLARLRMHANARTPLVDGLFSMTIASGRDAAEARP